MDRRRLLALAAALAAAPPARGGVAARMRLVTAHLPPLVLENGGRRPGALMELVTELCKRARVAPKTSFVPWRRAIFLATTMPATAIFPLTRLPDRENQFRWLAPLFEEHYIFLALRTSRFDLLHLDQMTARRVTIIRGAAQSTMLRALGYLNVVEAASVDEVHRFLLAGIADAAFGERNIIQTSLRARDAESDFDVSAPVRSTTAWLAGSLDFGQDDVQLFQRAAADMATDGSSRRILGKYGLG